MKKNKNILIFGGNRLLENGPVGELIKYLKKKKISFLLITDPDHLKKKTTNTINFKETIKGVKYLSFKKLNDKKVISLIDNNTLGLSINSIWKFSDELIKKFDGRLFNYHAANLPDERGAGNLTWKILQGNFKKNTINIHKVDKEFDTGDIVASKKLKFINKSYLPKDYLRIIAKEEIYFLINFVKRIMKKKKLISIKQKGDQYYWPKLNADKDGKIDWSWNVEDITLFIRGFSHPYSGAFSFINKNRVKIFNAHFIKKKTFHPFQNGIIFRESKSKIFVAHKTGYLILKKNNLDANKMLKSYLGKKFK